MNETVTRYYCFPGRLVKPRPWSENLLYNPSIVTIYICHSKTKIYTKDEPLVFCPVHASSQFNQLTLTVWSIHTAIIWPWRRPLQKYRETTGGDFSAREAETCTWRKASMRTTRTWSTMWRTTSTGSGWPLAPPTRRWRCGTSRRTGSGFALLGALQYPSQIKLTQFQSSSWKVLLVGQTTSQCW